MPNSTPIAQGNCVRCGKPYVEAPGIVRDPEVKEFYDRLGAVDIPGFDGFRHHAAGRERSGRKKFGFSYLKRDNPAEAMEEAADGGNYCLFEHAVRERAGVPDTDELSHLFEAARHFALAHAELRRYLAGKQGTP